jgi:hypothetical protein
MPAIEKTLAAARRRMGLPPSKGPMAPANSRLHAEGWPTHAADSEPQNLKRPTTADSTKRAPWLSLRNLKAAMVLAILVPASVFLIAAWQDYALRVQRNEQHVRNVTRLLEEHALKAFEAVELVVRQADERIKGLDQETIRTSRPLWDELVALQRTTERVGSIFAISAEGENFFTTRSFPPAPIDFSDRDYFRDQVAAESRVFCGACIHRQNQPAADLQLQHQAFES